MSKKIRVIVLPVILVSIMALFSLNGCGGGGAVTTPSGTNTWAGIPAESLSKPQLQQMLADAVNSYKNLNTYKFNIDMDIESNATGGSSPWSMNLSTKWGGGTNVASKQTQMTLDMSMAMIGMGQNGDKQTISYNMYALADWLYMNMPDFTTGGVQWIKVAMSDKVKQMLNLNTVDEQIKPLDSPTTLEYLRTEKVNGIDCYVLSVSPNADELAQWLSKQNTSAGNQDWKSLVNDSSAFKKYSLLCYLTKDTNLLTRMTVDMTLELTASQAGATPSAFDKMQMNLKMDMTLSDHNKPYSVTLPDEAASARLESEDIFLNSNQ
jgi:hypothetical protein